MPNQTRQLAAIMFTDIVGYTALMQENEQKAVALIKHYNIALNQTVDYHLGRVLNYYGDGSLCTFTSVTEAVNCALELQKDLQSEPNVPLRVGLHIGEVFFEGDKALGDGVNVASRIQSLGQANTILFSREIFDKIRNQPEFKPVSLGLFEFKNVAEPMEVFALANEGLRVPKREKMEGKVKVDATKKIKASRRKWIAVSTGAMLITIAGFLYYPFSSRTAFTGKEKSIAVLPFVNIGNDPNQDYLSDGITEEIITQLSKIADLKVISRSTAMLYKNSKKPVKQIAEEMMVSSILEGSVQKSGDEIRITAQLIDANTQEHIWAEHYDHRNLNDIFSIQSEVAQQIARELHARLSKEEKIKIEKKPTDNPEAYDLFLKGRYALNTYTLEGFHNAEVLFQEAIKKDPNFKLAYSYLANVYILLISMMGDLPPSAGVQKAMSILNKSLQKDTLYIDFETLSYIELWANKNYPKAEYYLGRVISLSPNEPTAYLNYAMLLTVLARTEEASVQIHKAKMLDPVNTFVLAALAENFYASGQYEEAIKTFKEAIQVFPSAQMLYDELGRVYVAKQNYPDAISILTEGLTRSSFRLPSTLAFLAVAYFETGNTKISSELIQELKQRANSGEKGINIFIALYYSAINHKEESFNYLDEALNTNDVDLIWLKQEPSFTNLHSDPRYNRYLKLVGF
jgi:adenylate cyclase